MEAADLEYLGDDDENSIADGQYQIYWKDPTQKGEVRSDGRSKEGFYFFDSQLPRYHPRSQIEQLSFRPT